MLQIPFAGSTLTMDHECDPVGAIGCAAHRRSRGAFRFLTLSQLQQMHRYVPRFSPSPAAAGRAEASDGSTIHP
eukprot:15468704-Alexandrium_andersonii.AAC.1